MSRLPNQLSIPWNLQQLPLLLSGIFRSAAVRPLTFAGSTSTSTSGGNNNLQQQLLFSDLRSNDERVAAGAMLVFATTDHFLSCVMPSCFCIWHPELAIGGSGSYRNIEQPQLALDEETGEPLLPHAELSSVESLKGEGMYLVDCGAKGLFLWVGKHVPHQVLLSFGLYNKKDPQGENEIYNNNSNNRSNNNSTFPEAIEAAQLCSQLVANRQSLLSERECGQQWGNILAIHQDAANVVLANDLSSSTNNNNCFNGLSIHQQQYPVSERLLYPFLVEDDMQEAVSYGTLLSSLAKKASEV